MIKQKEILLEIKNLFIDGYTGEQWVPIIKGVDLQLQKGEVIGLIGESGAGKSTMGAAAMGYARDGTRITKGSIKFSGIEITKASEKQKRALRGSKISYVAQSAAASFNPAHKIIDQHTEAPRFHKLMTKTESEADAIDLYNRLRLPYPNEIGFRYPHQVSGGQLQRAMTAMAMSCRPDLIIFDEPTTALDVTTQIEVLAAIRDIVEQFQTAAIYITHDLAVVAQMADRIKVLLKGEEVEEETTKQMLVAPKEDYTKSLWAVRSYKRDQKTRSTSTNALISLQSINASYGKGPKVLDGVTFDIFKGTTVAVVGESGSGKSTAARCISGLLPPSNGSILCNGEVLPPNFKDRTKKQLKQVQMIYQMADTALNPKIKIKDIIGRPAQFYEGFEGKKLDERVNRLLELIELEPDLYRDRLPPELSGGQKQRIGIARALAANPSFIICDEVTSALDQLVAEGILKLLDNLQKEFDLTYMFITHDLATVRAIADEVVVMQEGKVVEQGPKNEMFKPPHHPYTDLLLSSIVEMDPNWLTNVIDKRKSQIPGNDN